ncbi:MAG: glycosyltransferase, partial [Planctomycetota bacterium]
MIRTMAVIPTYNEAATIIPLVREVVEQTRDIEALVVDDDSPDGTARLVEEEAKVMPRVHLLLR